MIPVVGIEGLIALYNLSPPALLVVIAAVLYMTRGDVREALKEAKAGREHAEENARRLDRHEILLDGLATDAEKIQRARDRNDKRIRRLEQHYAVEHSDPLFRGGGNGIDEEPGSDNDPVQDGGNPVKPGKAAERYGVKEAGEDHG